MIKKYLECCKIINKRGIKGELKAECYCDSVNSLDNAKVLYSDGEGKNKLDVVSIKNYKGYLYIKLSGIDSPESADKMRGKVLYADRNDIIISPDSHFISDLIGLEVKDEANGKIYGTLSDVFNNGASDIYVITDGEKEFMIPAVSEIVVKVDTNDCILVRPIKGMFDDAEEIR